MRNQWIIIAALAAAAALTMSGCTGGSDSGTGSSENSTGGSDSESAPVSSGAENSGGGSGSSDGSTGTDNSEPVSENSTDGSSTNAAQQNVSDEQFSVKNEDGGVEIVKYLGEGGEVVIPEQIGGKTVVEIGDGAFRGCAGLTSVTIPGCVEDIGDEAFYNCSELRMVTIYDGVSEIGDRAFGGTALRGIYVPPSIDDIGDGAFSNPSLERVEVDANNRDYCEVDGVLFDKSVTKLYCYPCKIDADSYTVPNSVREIEEYAFLDCTGLKTLDIPDTVMEIERGAFDGCTQLTVNYNKAVYTSNELNRLYND